MDGVYTGSSSANIDFCCPLRTKCKATANLSLYDGNFIWHDPIGQQLDTYIHDDPLP